MNKVEAKVPAPTSRISMRLPALSWQQTLLPIIFIALIVTLSVLSPYFLTTRNLIQVLHQVSILGIVTVGMTYVIISGGFDLSMGSIVALSGCLAAVVMLKLPVVVGILVGLAAGALIGLVNGYLVAYRSVSPFIATLGTSVIGRGLALGVTGGGAIHGLPASFQALGSGMLGGVPVPVILLALISLLAWVVLRFHPFGVILYAVGGNSTAAHLSGIRVNRVIMFTYTVCGLLAAVAGVILSSRVRAGEPTVAVAMELFAVAAVVLGGARLGGGSGWIGWSLLGVLFIGFLENGLNLLNVPYYWQQVLVGIVFIVATAVTIDSVRRRRPALDQGAAGKEQSLAS